MQELRDKEVNSLSYQGEWVFCDPVKNSPVQGLNTCICFDLRFIPL